MKRAWPAELNAVERRTYLACLGGFALDSFDTTMYALVAPVLVAVVGLTRPDIGALATGGLIGNAIGGWGAGIVADRIGRVPVLKATILWVALFSILSALSSHFHEFLVVRLLQGLGYGGEAAVGGVLISEAVRPWLRARVASSVQAGYAIGYGLSTALMPVVLGAFAPALGWRVMFAIGVVPALLVLAIRRLLPESAAFRAASGAPAVPFWRIFAPSHLRRTLLGLMLAAGILSAGFAMSAWMPSYLRAELHLSFAATAGFLAMGIVGSLVGPFASGLLSDRIGRRPTFVVLALCEIVVVAWLLFGARDTLAIRALIFLHGALQGGAAAVMIPTFAELFPTSLRASGSGFCITGGRGVGAVAPATVGLLGATMPLGHAMGIATVTAFAVAILAALLLPERKGVALD